MGSWLRIRAIRGTPVTSGYVGYAAHAFTGTPKGRRTQLGSPTNSQLMPTPETTLENRGTRLRTMEIPRK